MGRAAAAGGVGGGGMGGEGGRGEKACDRFHCSERKLFREDLAKTTCHRCGSRGQGYLRCPQCAVRFCGAACQAAVNHRVPED